MTPTPALSVAIAMADDDRFLKERNGWWYVRVRVPRSLQSVLGSHIMQALHTKDKTKARELRWPVMTAIKAHIAATKANPVKALAGAWSDRRAAGRFKASEFVDLQQTLVRKHGDAAAAEFSERTFGIFTDLDVRETEWFADAKFEA